MNRDALAAANREVLRRFARSNVLAAFDYDGTLAPIAARPDGARMRGRTRELLGGVCASYPTVVISGRQRSDVLRRLRGVGPATVIGNHGIEPWGSRNAYRAQAAMWVADLRRALDGVAGVWVEDKRFSVTVHYRQARDLAGARRAIRRAASRLGEIRIVGGKRVYNVLPAGAPDKGIALETAVSRLGCDAAIYVGDDDTDDDVFRLQSSARLLTIRIGRRASPAMFRLRRQHMVDDLLETLVQLRRGGRSR
jgi:trehalose 6-phosphate phosphatase